MLKKSSKSSIFDGNNGNNGNFDNDEKKGFKKNNTEGKIRLKNIMSWPGELGFIFNS